MAAQPVGKSTVTFPGRGVVAWPQTPPAAAVPARPGPSAAFDGGGIGVSGFLAAAFVLLVYSRLPDVAFSSLRLPFVVAVCGLLVGAMRVPRVLMSRPGLLLILLTFWFAVCTVFSVWRGGSVQLLMDKWVDSFLIFLLTAALIRTPRAARAVGTAIGGSGVLIVVLVQVFGNTDIDGRLVMPAGTLANSNYLAMHLMLALPFLLVPAYERGRSMLLKPVAWVTSIVALGFLLGTGSRGTVVACGVMVLATFALTTGRGRAKLLVATAIVGVLLAAMIPDAISERIATTWGGGAAQDLDDEGVARAVTSTQARRTLLMDSLSLTIRHPLMGVGPGMFAVAQNDRAQADGREGAWHETHNTYTQLSSEAGLPAVGLYLGLMGWCWSRLRTMRLVCSAAAERYVPLMVAVQVCLAGYAAVAVFSSLGYDLYLPSLAGYCYGLSEAFRNAQGAEPSGVLDTVRG